MELKSQMSSQYRQYRAQGMNHNQAYAATGRQFAPVLDQRATNGDLMIKTKSIQEKSDPSDGRRISVMRFPKGKYDEEYRDLAPSVNLLMDYKKNKIDWDEYERRYDEEMKPKEPLIKELAERSKKETITLLCFEKTDEKCHRRLLKDLIEKIGSKLTGGKN